MLRSLLNRDRRPRTRLVFRPVEEGAKAAAHATGTYVVSDRDVPFGTAAYWHGSGKGYVLLGQAKDLRDAEPHCERAAHHLASGRALLSVKATLRGGGDRLHAVVAHRTLDGGMGVGMFGRPEDCLRLDHAATRDFLSGLVKVERLGDTPTVNGAAELLAECIAAPGLLSAPERTLATWGQTWMHVTQAHNYTVDAAERRRDRDALDTLRSYHGDQSRGMLPDVARDREAAAAASHLWDNLDVQKCLAGTRFAEFMSGLAELHDNRIRTDLYYPFR